MNGIPAISPITKTYLNSKHQQERKRKNQTRKTNQFAEYLNKCIGVDLRA